MLDKKIPADIISLIYPYSQTKVRFHRHSETDEIWIVGADICEILQLTNISYVANKLPSNKVFKHIVETIGGKQSVIWFEISAIYDLCRQQNAINLINWLRFTITGLPKKFSRNTYTFEDPVVIEKKTLTKLLEVIEELKSQNVI